MLWLATPSHQPHLRSSRPSTTRARTNHTLTSWRGSETAQAQPSETSEQTRSQTLSLRSTSSASGVKKRERGKDQHQHYTVTCDLWIYTFLLPHVKYRQPIKPKYPAMPPLWKRQFCKSTRMKMIRNFLAYLRKKRKILKSYPRLKI